MRKLKKLHYSILIVLGCVMIALTLLTSKVEELPEITLMTGTEVLYNKESLGIIDACDSQTYIMEEAFSRLTTETGQKPFIDINFESVSSENLTYTSREVVISKLTDAFMTFQDTLKTFAVKLTIDDTEFILSSRADVENVLESALEEMIKSEHEVVIDVQLSENEVASISFVEESISETELCSIEMLESISVENTKVDAGEITSVPAAVSFITKLKEKPVSYEVVSGDVPSMIAAKNNMRLTTLYDLNPGLENNETSLQIGEDLIITVPEPEMSVAIVERIVYEEPIYKPTRYTTDSGTYIGTNKTINYGSDGITSITATIKTVNGLETERVIENESVIKAAVEAVVSKGSKALPSKGSVGNFISPLTEYHITSYFGSRWNDFHRGIDMGSVYGASVRASDGGVVTFSGWNNSYGYYVEIDHGNGVRTRYAHNSKLLVSVGDYVSQYQEIAKVGSTGNSTGPHVHFEILIDGNVVNPYDYIE